MLERMKRGSNPYQTFASEHARLFQSGKKLPPGTPKPGRKISDTAPRLLIFSPHPDDECLVGGLALRLSREAKWNVINVAVTLGSERERRRARQRELQNACDFLGFGLIVAGLEQINLETRRKNRPQWKASVRMIAGILVEHQPRVIFLPHEKDVHPTHAGTHFLVLDALKTLPKKFSCFVVETEFWGQMADPNLLIESSTEDAGDLVAALACHVGEVKRNPYHARLPAGLMDNVRRGAELVGGPGGAAPDFTFGTIYRLQKWRGGKLGKIFNGGKFLNAKKNPAGLF
jgi:LmbE family N-acetylglucosaminyl deacetylase